VMVSPVLSFTRTWNILCIPQPSWNICVALHCWGTVSVMFQFSAVMSPMLVVVRV